MTLLRSSILLLFLFISTSFGQITITSGDILGLIGESHLLESDGSGSTVTVDVGSAGANQTWDLSGISLPDPIEMNVNYLSPGNTPYADDFPSANLAFRLPFDEFGFTGTGYNYIQVLSDQVTSLGFAAELTDPDSSFVDYNEEEVVELPLAYGNSWTSTNIDTFEFLPGFGTITIMNTESIVDGYGTVKLKAGDFDCLRLKDVTEEIIQTLVEGQVLFTDTTSSISYSWIGKESFLFAEIESTEGENDPNFTQADFVQLTSSLNAPNALFDVGEIVVPDDLVLFANYPNPFNPSTTIRFDVPQTGLVNLTIYDLNGRLIETLVNENMAAVSHSVTWNGHDASGISVASGVYIYRLQQMGRVQSRKLTLLR
jgi:hypothetical protein